VYHHYSARVECKLVKHRRHGSMMTRIRVESIAVVEVDAGDREVRTAAGQRLAVPPAVDDPASPAATTTLAITTPNTMITALGIYDEGRGSGVCANECVSFYVLVFSFSEYFRRAIAVRQTSETTRRQTETVVCTSRPGPPRSTLTRNGKRSQCSRTVSKCRSSIKRYLLRSQIITT